MKLQKEIAYTAHIKEAIWERHPSTDFIKLITKHHHHTNTETFLAYINELVNSPIKCKWIQLNSQLF